MNPSAMMQLMAAINTFKTNHPKFTSFLEKFLKNGVTEGTIIEVTVMKPGEEPITANMKVMQSDIDLIRSLKDLKG